MIPLASLIVALALVPGQETSQEKPKVPKDSVELTVIGCLKGRVLKTVEQRQADVESGPYVGSRSFHLLSKKPVTDELKKQQNHLVEVTGIVKRSSLDDKGMKAGPVAINGGAPVAGTGPAGSMPRPTADAAEMDVSSVRMRASSCTPQ
jgi:hypothetical protein